MAASIQESKASWYRRFVGRLEPGERLGELLFGLIMVLTFTLGAGIELGDHEETRELLIAALGCNTAWGIIDAALYLLGRLSERGRLHRLVRSIQQEPADAKALTLVARELDERLPEIVQPEMRTTLNAHVLAQVRAMEPIRNRITGADLWAALAVFWLVFLTALPAAAPFLLISQPHVAMRTSNAILIGLLVYVGWRWAAYTGGSPWRTGLCMALLGVGLVLVAIPLGG